MGQEVREDAHTLIEVVRVEDEDGLHVVGNEEKGGYRVWARMVVRRVVGPQMHGDESPRLARK